MNPQVEPTTTIEDFDLDLDLEALEAVVGGVYLYGRKSGDDRRN